MSTSDQLQQRIREKVERAIPNEEERCGALALLACAIENADDERNDAWELRQTPQGLALFVGRRLGCRLMRGKVEMSVMGPVTEETRAILGIENEESDAWKAIPGGVSLSFHVEKALQARELLQDSFEKFVDEAMARVRRKVSLEYHVPEAVAYVSSVVGRDLPQPSESEDMADEDDIDSEDETAASREPKVRGRAPMFDHAQLSIGTLISDIDRKKLALPDLQRPFVWEDTKVRDLLDSIFVGFPVGTIVLWHTSDVKEARPIGGPDALKTTTLIIDGQQRLTSLYAVMRGAEVTEKDGTKRRITIAFRPRDGRFEVADAAIRNDPEFLPNVSELWSQNRTKGQTRKELLASLREKGRLVDEAYENAVEENLDRAHAISEYNFPVVNIQKTNRAMEANEEDVAEIFVRINNQGKRLGHADFVLTLLSVFHGPLRDQVEQRSTEMSLDAVIAIDAQQLLRATCAVGFHRARMSAIYRFLRGIDPTTGDTSVTARQERLERLERAAAECIDSTTWRDYMLRVMHAGAVSPALVASNNAIVNAYAFYVLGKRIGVPKHRLDELISRWVFGTLLSARYSTGSSESVFERDLTRVEGLHEDRADDFVTALDDALGERITGDYWANGLVGALETQRGKAPSALAFRAAQIILGARALFSDQTLRNLFAPPGKAKRAASEAHHLFPKAWLIARGIKERRQINQVANLADVGWYENGTIGAKNPAEYVPRLRDQLRLDDDRWGRACAEHALPLGWETMDYDTFLAERRQRMAELTRVAFRQLGGEGHAPPIPPPWFLPGAELVWQRIVETERSLRALVRTIYSKRYSQNAAAKIEQFTPDTQRETLNRALRARPSGADPLSVVDYLYLAQLPPLLFNNEVWQDARARLGATQDAKQRLQFAIDQIVPVRNEIAHVREIPADRLQKANVACGDVLAMLRAGT
ncbi:DUF262 domain-containing protein [Pendulispora rubella]|uniref:DUF262 domain-containing protein n=1 Tax=Pendulispora rubella TaxID=2741070 RepID=A0ABZ2KZT9_9BACT